MLFSIVHEPTERVTPVRVASAALLVHGSLHVVQLMTNMSLHPQPELDLVPQLAGQVETQQLLSFSESAVERVEYLRPRADAAIAWNED